MNAEFQHQLYGGEIADYIAARKDANIINTISNTGDSKSLESIYNNSIKNKGSIDTTNLLNPSFDFRSLIDHRDPDPLLQQLSDTIAKISADISLESEPLVDTQAILAPKNQTQDDILHAQDNVARALAELKDLGAV